MKRIIYMLLIAGSLTVCSCSKDIDAPSLPEAENDPMEQGVAIDPAVLFGVWEGTAIHQGSTLSNTFEQTYRLDFQSVEDGEVLYSHWYADARTNDRDSVLNQAYAYSFDGTTADMTPAKKGLSTMKAVHTGNNQIALYSIQGSTVQKVCTLVRTSDPQPVITDVDRTMPQTGETVTVTGRNLQFVDHVFLPTATGELEVTNFTKTSRQIRFEVPAADYAPGSVRCQATGAHVSTYSPAYMFCTGSVFFHTFSTAGGKAPYWTGTEFENTVGISNSDLIQNAVVVSSANIPAGHSLDGVDVKSPDYFLSFYGETPKPWAVDTGLDPSTGHLRFSFADRIQYVLDNCGGILTADTKCADAAIQMDVYVYSDGEPVWKTGFISFRLDKDQGKSLTQGWFGQTAMWETGNPVSFEEGWKTFTIPMSAFAITENALYDTLGKLSSYFRNKPAKTHSIVKFLNYQLDASHPAQELASFQLSIANMRLVSIKAISNKKE